VLLSILDILVDTLKHCSSELTAFFHGNFFLFAVRKKYLSPMCIFILSEFNVLRHSELTQYFIFAVFTLFIQETVFVFAVLNKYLVPSFNLCFEFRLISYSMVFCYILLVVSVFYYLSMRTLFSNTLNRFRHLRHNLMSLSCKHFP
jgi:hypothetical protein